MGRTDDRRIAYFGTPDYAVPALLALHADPRYSVELVVTQPDRPAGRGRRLTAPPVKIAAQERGLQVYQPASLRSAEARRPLEDVQADAFVVAAYGLIFGRRTLALPRHGSLNLHASLLPRYRGASPIPASILQGDAETGVTLMVMEAGLDTGPIIATATVSIAPDDTTESLTARLATLAATLVVDQLGGYLAGGTEPVSQPHEGISMTRSLVKRDGWIDWTLPAALIERQVRAFWPWPRAWTQTFEASTLQIHRARALDSNAGETPGRVESHGGEVIVSCGVGCLALDKVQSAGGKPITARDWLAGLKGRLPAFESPAKHERSGPIVQPLVARSPSG
jgi:methionyl-tRNA formyltransferase